MQHGPAAPRDPREKGKKIYLLLDTPIDAVPRADGAMADEIYLDDGRLREKVAMMNGITRPEILALFDTAAGFRTLVAGVGVSFTAAATAVIDTTLVLYGSPDLSAKASCPADGSETVLWLDELPFTGRERVVGQLRFLFPREEMTARVTVVFYLRPGYDLPAPVLEPPVDFASPDYQALLARAQLSAGNNARLKAVFAKAERGEEIGLSFIGGSITQGAGAKPIQSECYAFRTRQGLQALLGCQIAYTKAGIGGTSSELGMIRFEQDALRGGRPDVIVIEFAVNDEGDETGGRCYESLVRKALALPWQPAVLLLFSVFSNDWNLQGRLAPIGRYYNLPMVSVLDAVVPQFGKPAGEGGVITKRQYFYDAFHPTNEGHRVMADCLLRLFGDALAAPADPPVLLPARALTGRTFEDVRLLRRAHPLPGAEVTPGGFAAHDADLQCCELDESFHPTPQFPENWAHLPGGAAAPLILRLRCKSLFLLEKDAREEAFGKAAVTVDGKPCRVIDPHDVGWTHCNALLLFESDTPALHTVTVAMAPGDGEKQFTVLGFGVC